MWTTTDLLADVRRRAMLPTTSTLGLADSDILEHANNEMATRLVPLVTSVNEEFYVQTLDVAVTAGKSSYRVPDRSAGGKLRDVTYILGASVLRLPRIEPEQLPQFVVSAAGTPMGFYMEAGSINLIPSPAGGGTLRMKYFVRPGRFTVATTDVARITVAPTYTGNSVALTYSTGGSPYVPGNGKLVDVIAYRPPFEYLAVDCLSSGTGVGVITLTAGSSTTPAPDLSPNIQPEDLIHVRGLSTVIQLPIELHSLLVQRTVCAIMESLNYAERLDKAEGAYARMEEAALKLITPRVDGSPRKMRGLLNTMGRYGMGPR